MYNIIGSSYNNQNRSPCIGKQLSSRREPLYGKGGLAGNSESINALASRSNSNSKLLNASDAVMGSSAEPLFDVQPEPKGKNSSGNSAMRQQ